jgi:hypothetical protein
MVGTTALERSRRLRTRPIRNRPRTPRWGQVEHNLQLRLRHAPNLLDSLTHSVRPRVATTERIKAKYTAKQYWYSGKHHRHGAAVQTIAAPDGELLWVSGVLPGRTVEVTAARRFGIAEKVLAHLGLLADLGYIGLHPEAIYLEDVDDPRRRLEPRHVRLAAAQGSTHARCDD